MDARVGVQRDGSQLPHPHWGPETDLGRLKRCRPSRPARDVCLRSKLGDTQGERCGEPQKSRSLIYRVKNWGSGLCK
jgi:hypothetical protein